MKNFKASHYMLAVFIAGVIGLVYFSQGQSQQSEPKIKLSYFNSNQEVAEAVYTTLQPEIKSQTHFWFGIEPQAERELEIYKELKMLIEKNNGPFEIIYVDRELKLSPEEKSLFGTPEVREIKDDWGGVAKDLEANKGKKILVITASIYSTNLIAQNPISKMKSVSQIEPTTFSMGYFAVKTEDEKKIIFPCLTDDKEGVSGWGCVVVNKARGQRRKLDITKITAPNQSIIGLMDLTGKKDYMILIR